jgi:hypothetical protein
MRVCAKDQRPPSHKDLFFVVVVVVVSRATMVAAVVDALVVLPLVILFMEG